MNLESIYKSRPFLFEAQQDDVGGGEEIVAHLIQNSEIKEFDSIEFLSSNYEYDSYLVIKDNIGYCVKYSFDPNNTSLKNEAQALQQLSLAHPKMFDCQKIKFGDVLHYSITSFEFAENVKDFGLASLIENWDAFFGSYARVKDKNAGSSFFEYLNSFYATTELNNFPEDALAAVKDYYDFDALKDLLASVKYEINHLSKPSLVKKDEFCHGRLQPSNILTRNGMFKMIDFVDCYAGNHFLDLARLSIYLGLDANKEKEMLSSFLKLRSESLTKENWQEYRSCYDIMIRLVFIELIVSYLKEVYIYSSFRPAKILSIIEVFSKNNTSFFRLPVIGKYHEFVYNMMLEPLIGKES